MPAGSWRSEFEPGRGGGRSSSTPTPAARRPARRCWRRIKRALESDPVSAFGGVIGINREVDGAAAEEIAKLFVEAIVAPVVHGGGDGAVCREEESAAAGDQARRGRKQRVLKQVSGGFLMQDADRRGVGEAEI